MIQTAMRPIDIDYSYDRSGEVVCQNRAGLVFFLHAEPPAPKAAANWQPVEATKEVAVRRAQESAPIVEMSRPIPEARPAWKPVEATHEVEVRRADAPAAPAARGTGALPDVPLPGKQPERGWFGKLFHQ